MLGDGAINNPSLSGFLPTSPKKQLERNGGLQAVGIFCSRRLSPMGQAAQTPSRFRGIRASALRPAKVFARCYQGAEFIAAAFAPSTVYQLVDRFVECWRFAAAGFTTRYDTPLIYSRNFRTPNFDWTLQLSMVCLLLFKHFLRLSHDERAFSTSFNRFEQHSFPVFSDRSVHYWLSCPLIKKLLSVASWLALSVESKKKWPIGAVWIR